MLKRHRQETAHGIRGLTPQQAAWLIARVERDRSVYFELNLKFRDKCHRDDATSEFNRRASAAYCALMELGDCVSKHAGAGHPVSRTVTDDASIWIGDGI